MAEGVDNLVLEQLRLIREDIARVEERLGGRIARVEDRVIDLEGKVDGQTAIMIALGKYIHDIDGRVERLEEKLGATT